MKIDNNIGQRVKLNDEYLKETYLGYAFPTITGGKYSFLFVADEPNEKFHDGAGVADEYPKGFNHPDRCWWVSDYKYKLEVLTKVIL